jgi:intracellular sulfur oxidation DsrE/DsrF family protein
MSLHERQLVTEDQRGGSAFASFLIDRKNRRRRMTTFKGLRFSAAMLVATIGAAMAPWSSTYAQGLPVPSQGVMSVDFEGATQTPNPKLTYKVAFDVKAESKSTGELNGGLVRVARYLNTLAKYGVPKEKREIAIVISGPATEAIASGPVFSARNGGAPNPNLKLIIELHDAGVQMYVCGVAMKAHKLAPADLAPHIQPTLSATVTMLNLQAEGYTRTQ